MNSLWRRFAKARDSRNATELLCHSCPYAQEIEYLEKLLYPDAFRNLSNFRDGSLVQKAKRPKEDSKQCQGCFESWVNEKKYEGKICTRCDIWITKGNGGMVIEAKYEDGSKKRSAVCSNCLTGGKSVDEWAAGVVARSKGGKKDEKSNSI